MVTLTYGFNDYLLKRDNIKQETVLEKARKYFKIYNIKEVDEGVFKQDGEDALALILNLVMKEIKTNPYYWKYLNKLELDTDGEREDCFSEFRKLRVH